MPPHPDAVTAAEKTGHRRFLELCDPGHPDYDPRYLPVVAGIARPGAPALPPPPARAPYEPLTRSWLARVNTCPFRECPVGCAATRCHAGRGDRHGNTSLENCRACLRAADPTPEAIAP